MNTYAIIGNLGAHENPLVVAAILLALSEQKHKNFTLDQLIGDEIDTDGNKLYKALQASLERAKVSPEVKKERVLSQFTLIKDRPILQKKRIELSSKTPLKFFAEFINDNVYKNILDDSSEDYIGRFYMEFIRYTGGDAQSLGVVITPRHITELFCDLVDLKPDDVIFDPCCGTGGFLISGMHRMLNTARNETERREIKKSHIHGIELREDMFSMATTSMILHGDGQSNLLCEDFFGAEDLYAKQITVGFMNPPYSQAKNKETAHLSELSFTEHLSTNAVIPLSSAMGI